MERVQPGRKNMAAEERRLYKMHRCGFGIITEQGAELLYCSSMAEYTVMKEKRTELDWYLGGSKQKNPKKPFFHLRLSWDFII